MVYGHRIIYLDTVHCEDEDVRSFGDFFYLLLTWILFHLLGPIASEHRDIAGKVHNRPFIQITENIQVTATLTMNYSELHTLHIIYIADAKSCHKEKSKSN